MTCTVPKLFGIQDWFDKRFKDLCLQHDRLYSMHLWMEKFEADFSLSWQLVKRKYIILGMLALIYTLTLGTIYWLWKKYK